MTIRAPILTDAVQDATIVRDFEASPGAATSGEVRERSSRATWTRLRPTPRRLRFQPGYWPTRLMPDAPHDVSTVHAHVA
jgi:hypothetical protein